MSSLASRQAVVPVVESSQIGDARRCAARIAESTRLSESDRGKVGIIATELATNLVRHGGGGKILIRPLVHPQADGVEILAIDKGPGMADLDKCLADGFSTAGTPGTGLGAIRRLSTEFDVYSQLGAGTVAFARVTGGAAATKTRWSAISTCAAGETVCGDAWSLHERDQTTAILVADGLGHGPMAAEAAEKTVQIFETDPFRAPGLAVERMHSALHGTRGAAVMVIHLDRAQQVLKHAGVGNIGGSLLTADQGRGLFSHNGTVGLQIRKIQEINYPWSPGTLLVIHSDGLQSRWKLSDYPGLSQRHPAVIAGVLHRDFLRGRDDMTLLVIR